MSLLEFTAIAGGYVLVSWAIIAYEARTRELRRLTDVRRMRYQDREAKTPADYLRPSYPANVGVTLTNIADQIKRF